MLICTMSRSLLLYRYRMQPPHLRRRPRGNDRAGSSLTPGSANSGSAQVAKRSPNARTDIAHTPGTGKGTCVYCMVGWGEVGRGGEGRGREGKGGRLGWGGYAVL